MPEDKKVDLPAEEPKAEEPKEEKPVEGKRYYSQTDPTRQPKE